MPGPTPHPPETRARALELLRNGQSANAVARALGIAVHTVTRWARKAGIALDNPGGPRRRTGVAARTDR